VGRPGWGGGPRQCSWAGGGDPIFGPAQSHTGGRGQGGFGVFQRKAEPAQRKKKSRATTPAPPRSAPRCQPACGKVGFVWGKNRGGGLPPGGKRGEGGGGVGGVSAIPGGGAGGTAKGFFRFFGSFWAAWQRLGGGGGGGGPGSPVGGRRPLAGGGAQRRLLEFRRAALWDFLARGAVLKTPTGGNSGASRWGGGRGDFGGGGPRVRDDNVCFSRAPKGKGRGGGSGDGGKPLGY